MKIFCRPIALSRTLKRLARPDRAGVAVRAVALAAVAAVAGDACAGDIDAEAAWSRSVARAIYAELVGLDTRTFSGDTARAAEAMAEHFRAAGFPAEDIHVFTPAPRKGDLVVRLRGTGWRRPILLLAHLDVVDADRADWSVDPFVLTERDGFFYGRGSDDDKYMASAFIASLLRFKREGFVPDRDLVLVLETDEEILDANGVGIRWLIRNHFDLIDAEFALNEGGSVSVKGGRVRWNSIQTSEKMSITFRLEVHNPGGHSAVPLKDNAIYRLAAGLERLARLEFPVRLSDNVRRWLETAATHETGQRAEDLRSAASAAPSAAALERLSRDPELNAQLRTTCVATMLEGGHAPNALPQLAAATVNCRLLPGESAASVQETLVSTLGDSAISVRQTGTLTVSPPSTPPEDLVRAARRLTEEFWPGTPVVPVMSAGATDGSFLRNAGIPTFGHSGLAVDGADVHAHGRDERIPVASYERGVEYLYRLIKAVSGGG